MSAAREIPTRGGQSTVTNSFDPSSSPTATFTSPPASFKARTIQNQARELKPFHTKDIKVLLLENVNQTGRDILSGQGYQVEALKSSLSEDQLIEKIR